MGPYNRTMMKEIYANTCKPQSSSTVTGETDKCHAENDYFKLEPGKDQIIYYDVIIHKIFEIKKDPLPFT